MPAGKAMASVAMPTAVLMGLGVTSTLALADSSSTSASAKSLTADEYQECLEALDDSAKKPDATASPSPSASQSTSASPSPSKTAEPQQTQKTQKSPKTQQSQKSPEPGPQETREPERPQEQGGTVSPDTGSGGTAPGPAGTSGSTGSTGSGTDTGSGTGTGAGSGTGTGSGGAADAPVRIGGVGGDVLDAVGDTVGDILTGGKGTSGTPSAIPEPSASASPAAPAAAGPSGSGSGAADPGSGSGSSSSSGAGSASGTREEKAGKAQKAQKAAGAAEDTIRTAPGTPEDVTRTLMKAAQKAKDAGGKAGDATASATASPSASASLTAEDCPAATDRVGGVDNEVLVADDPWYLDASKLTLDGADYQGVVEVRTASGATKKVLKYVVSGGTRIDDLHQTVKDKQSGRTYHVQAAKGSESTITGGRTTMYTESISGNLLGLVPVTFTPDNPPPLNIPWIMFTRVTVVQAAQFGGTLHIPGMRVYTTD
ncbi:hypothetical protein [Streptomyces sp. NPDC006193]|uniref:hypothetical protein n=1 Tax=Streptomyces sp. NPDC006193 TaxID=3155717 RepID=UPI0033BEE74F